MQRAECVAFLQWALPQMRMRWPGFRKVRSQVCKRIARRLAELGLDDFDDYRHYLSNVSGEWSRLNSMCRITISRFYRDRGVFEALAREILPPIAESARSSGRPGLRIWSCGCASGEEPYTLAMVFRLGLPDRYTATGMEIVASDADPTMLARAERGEYSAGSLRELPDAWRESVFTAAGENYSIADSLRRDIRWLCQDVRRELPPGVFDLVLCRNLIFTYYEDSLQLELEQKLAGALRPGGALVIGSHESLPVGSGCFERWLAAEPVYRRLDRS